MLSFLSRMLPAEVIARPQDYRTAVWTIAYSFFFKAELAAAMFLVLVVGPNLVSRDLRFNALPLYFSRPLRRIDYFVGKLGVIGFFLVAIAIVPATGRLRARPRVQPRSRRHSRHAPAALGRHSVWPGHHRSRPAR